MRSLARIIAVTTVLLAAPFVSIVSLTSRLVATRETIAAQPIGLPSRDAGLPSGWSSKLFGHLQKKRLPLEVGDLQAVIRHVEGSASRFQMDPLTVLAVIRVESGFNPFAVSTAGAMGLMQLRVDTARDVAAALGIPWTSEERLFEPELNVLLGTCYLKQLLDRFGDLNVALAAFHEGPSRVALRGPENRAGSGSYADRVGTTRLALLASMGV